jgi:PAS domain S-box-containing protein
MPPRTARAHARPVQSRRGRRQPSREAKLLAGVNALEKSLQSFPATDVDALVVYGNRGARLVTLRGGETAYRTLVEAMSEGAATVSADGVVLYCNRRLAELVGISPSNLVGLTLLSLIEPHQVTALKRMLRSARLQAVKGEFSLQRQRGQRIPVHLSLSKLEGYRGAALGMVVTDLTEQKRKQAEEINRAESTHRLLLERELAAQERERRRIARELHDEAGQLLTSLLVSLRRLEDSADMATCKSLARRMREIAAQAIDEVGRLARGLHPIALEDVGLDAALRRLAAEYSHTHGTAIQLEVEGLNGQPLSPPVQIALYRILQESLTNVVRHARARKVSIRLRRGARLLILTVNDDGRGFDTAAAVSGSSTHLGLQSIRERALLLGGAANFISGRKGTQIQVEIPLALRQAAALKRQNRA